MGRKRKLNVVRYPNGTPHRHDDPRLVVLAQPHRRGWKVETKENGRKVRDQRLDQRAENPLGGLNLVGAISDAQYLAGKEYARVVARYRVVLAAPKPYPRSIGSADRIEGGYSETLLSDDECERRESAYQRAFEALWDAGQSAAHAVARVAVYEEACPHGRFSDLIRGLEALSLHFGLTKPATSGRRTA